MIATEHGGSTRFGGVRTLPLFDVPAAASNSLHGGARMSLPKGKLHSNWGSSCGMGVIEVMVGLGLMAVAVMGLNSLAISAVRNNLSSRLIDQATRLAQQKIEQIKRDGYAAAVTGTTVETKLNASGNPGGGFQRTTVIAAGTLPNTLTVTVAIAWMDYGMRQTSFSTQITQ
jgi:Tfp pilus assembly protein PilV